MQVGSQPTRCRARREPGWTHRQPDPARWRARCRHRCRCRRRPGSAVRATRRANACRGSLSMSVDWRIACIPGLLVENRAGRRVRTVHLCMTGDAAAADEAFVGMCAVGERARRLQVVGMPEAAMALLAQQRTRGDQQLPWFEPCGVWQLTQFPAPARARTGTARASRHGR